MSEHTTQTRERSNAPLSDCLLGHIDDPTGQVYDACHYKRATAISYFAGEWGIDVNDVKCTTRYGRWLTWRYIWDDYGRERWADELEDHVACPACGAAVGEACDEQEPCREREALVPDEPPEGWEPDEYDPAWQFCKADDEGARKIYVCEEKLRV